MPYRTIPIVLIALAAVVTPLDAAEFVPPDGPSVVGDQFCGTCADYDPYTCELLEMSEECHVWEYDTIGANKRGNDAHAVAGEFEVGNGTCNEEHEGPCWGGGGSDEVPVPDEDLLLLALQAGDRAVVEQFFALPSGLWLEYNRERMAFQMMGMCENLDDPIVVAHLPVSAETASLWADVDLRPVP